MEAVDPGASPHALTPVSVADNPKPAADARATEVSSSVDEVEIARWREQKLKQNPHGYISTAEEFEYRNEMQKSKRAPVFSDSISELIADAKANPAVPIIERVLHRGDRLLIHGYEETMKSFIVLTMADAMAAGKPWLGEFGVGTPMTVGILETEMHNPGLGERLAAMYEGQTPDRIKFFSREKLREFRRRDTRGRFKLIQEWVEHDHIDIVLCDVISDVFVAPLSPDRETDVSLVFDLMELIPEVKAWVLVRHDSKPSKDTDSENSNNRIRGSSEWKENVETILHLTRDGRSNSVTITVGKLRYGRKPAPLGIRYDLKTGTIVPANPVLTLLSQLGDLSREELVVECNARYKVSESRVDKWLKEIDEHIDRVQEGHRRIFRRVGGPSAETLWKFPTKDYGE